MEDYKTALNIQHLMTKRCGAVSCLLKFTPPCCLDSFKLLHYSREGILHVPFLRMNLFCTKMQTVCLHLCTVCVYVCELH